MSPVLAANPLVSADFLLTVGLLAVVLVAGAVVLYATDAWRKRQLDDSTPGDSPLTLNHYHELFEAGELTEGEYKRVRERLAGKKPAAPEPSLPAAEPPAELPPP